MKFYLPGIMILMIAFSSCGIRSNSSDIVADDSAREVTDDTLTNVYGDEHDEDDSVALAVPDQSLKDADTLFNFLARLQLVKGEFESVEVVTNSFVDPGNLKSGDLIAVVVTSGEGEYIGGREDIGFATQHALLAVLQWNEKEQLELVDHLDLGSTESMGLYAYTVESDAFMLAEDRYGVLVHNKSSEEGAGDSGFRRDDVTLYVLLNGKITAVFENTIDDFHFSSDEQGSWYESTTTVVVTALEEKTNGLFNIGTQASTVTSGSEPEGESEPAEEPAVESNPDEEGPADDGSAIFKWNGERYQEVVIE